MPRLVGEDVAERVRASGKKVWILVEHPTKTENNKILEQFLVDSHWEVLGKINGLNESQEVKLIKEDQKLPAIIQV